MILILEWIIIYIIWTIIKLAFINSLFDKKDRSVELAIETLLFEKQYFYLRVQGQCLGGKLPPKL